MTQKLIVICTLLFLILLVGAPRAAAKKKIPLSTHSSEISVDPGLLDADLDISIELLQAKPDKDEKKWLLTLTAANLTPEIDGFSIDELYFNTTASPGDIEQFKFKDLVGGGNKNNWDLTYDTDNISAADFGLFDISLVSTSERIEPQETFIFTIEIKTTFAPEYTEEDFFTLSSAPPGGTTTAYGAGYFFDGPEEQIAYGAYALTPEPATILLLGLGGLALLRKRRV